jgi:anti-sigma regulatory factor (Ser/Thr protein kinase)
MRLKEAALVATATRRATTAATLHFAHTTSSVRSARRRLANDLEKRGVPKEIVNDAVLVLSEVLSNAVRHARPLGSGKVKVAWDVRAGAVAIEVTDGGGATHPHPAQPSLSSLGGRGLGIVTTLTSDWGLKSDAGESTVWAVLPLDGRDQYA